MNRFKKYISLLLTLMMIFMLSSCGEDADENTVTGEIQSTVVPLDSVSPEKRTIRISVTETIGNSGFMMNLKRAFEEETSYKLEISSNGNSTAVSVAQAGKADLLWIFSGTAAQQFVSAGYGIKSEDIMHDYYVLAGPSHDPANVKNCNSMKDAFTLICEEGTAGFVSRGDDSDLCMAEKSILSQTGYVVGSGNSWYSQAKTGMASSLMTASEKGAYILTDRETFLQLEKDLSLKILTECHDMKNIYTLISMNPEVFENTNTQGADAFREWLKTETAREIIDDYGVSEYGEDLFDF